jgi:hypothetical protein
MKTMTAGYKIWLWFRWVLAAFGGCVLVAGVVLICHFVAELIDGGHPVLGILIFASLASFGAGTLGYFMHRDFRPEQYGRDR